jgi:SAM-dependent methyltransferase
MGEHYPVINRIPRFVPLENYASSFGLQWNAYRRTQLDSYTGLPISKSRLTRLAGGSLDIFKEKNVLEAGCGAGRFTEIMLQEGANVFAVDISTAVEANYLNCNAYPNYFVCQADILELPLLPEQFDVVVCVGVIQHTPDPERSIRVLCSHVKPGGLLILDHYTYGYSTTPIRRFLRSFLQNRTKEYTMNFIQTLCRVLWPCHKILYRTKDNRVMRKIRPLLLYWSPVVDYQDAYPELDDNLLFEWATLDTHDTLTDCYKHLRSAEQIHEHLEASGMVEIVTLYAGNGVEARARKPLGY